MNDIPTGNSYDKYASANPIERRLMSGFWNVFNGRCLLGQTESSKSESARVR